MKTIALTFIFWLLETHLGFSQAGILDSTFNFDGIASFPNGAAHSIAIQPDGKIILGGGWDNFSLLRFNIDGSLDSSFGNNGITTTLMGTGSNTEWGIVLQPDGKILASGECLNFSYILCFALARFNSDGSLDNSFSSDGKVYTSFHNPAILDEGFRPALQADGKIIQVGQGNTGAPTSYFAIVRYNSDGALDNSFGNGGKVLTFVGPNPFPLATSVSIQPDQKVLVGGMSWSDPGPSTFSLARYNSDGSLDNTFGSNGIVSTYLGDGSSNDRDAGLAMALQPDGKILMTGESYSGQLPIVRYNSDGSLDNSFGVNGKVITPIDTALGATGYSITLQPDGKILIAGIAYYDITGNDNNILVARFNSTGTLDDSFGSHGLVIISLSNTSEGGYAVTMQSDGKIVIGGEAQGVGWVAARLLSGLNVGLLDLSTSNLSPLIYPNPIQSQANLQYTLTTDECISISLYNIQGSKVQTFITNETRNQGEHKEVLDLDEAILSGEYILSISNGVHNQSIKIVKQ